MHLVNLEQTNNRYGQSYDLTTMHKEILAVINREASDECNSYSTYSLSRSKCRRLPDFIQLSTVSHKASRCEAFVACERASVQEGLHPTASACLCLADKEYGNKGTATDVGLPSFNLGIPLDLSAYNNRTYESIIPNAPYSQPSRSKNPPTNTLKVKALIMRPLLATFAFLLPLCLGYNITARDGIVAGFHGVYSCTEMHWKGSCTWHEIPYADIESQKCFHIQYPSFGSIGPDKGLGVTYWGSPDCRGNPLPTLDPLTCPGTDVLGSQQIVQGVKDLYFKVKLLKRKDLPKTLPEICEFED